MKQTAIMEITLVELHKKNNIYRTMILPVVLYGFETWSLTLREERRLRVFENRVLRVFGPKRDEVTGEWGKLHNEDLRDLYSLPNIMRVVKSRRMRWVGHMARVGKGRGVHGVLVGKPEGKRPLGRSRRRMEDNITTDPGWSIGSHVFISGNLSVLNGKAKKFITQD